MTPIHPVFLAAKIQAARNGDPEASAFAAQLEVQPRLLETLWFLQDMSRRAGGTPRFVQHLIEAFPDRFQSKIMAQAGPPSKAGQWSLEQCLPVWQEDNDASAPTLEASDLLGVEAKDRQLPSPSEVDSISYHDWLSWFIGPEITAKDAHGSTLQAKALRAGLVRFNRPFHQARCLAAARHDLSHLLSDWCENKGVTCKDPWYCPELLATLCDFMDRHTTEATRALAETEVTRIAFRELDFARSQCVPVPIVGASRFGKTKAVSVWAEMHPGAARLVTVPDSNRERDFFAAHADAFGIEYGHGTTTAELKGQVEFVHRHSGLFLVYDEASFLIPVSYHKATPPRRLNWVRCQVIDRGLGCAFFATPQSYRETLAAYVKKTGYCMEQWLGRMAPPVVLPESLCKADVLAVARNHFPDVPEPCLKVITGRAMQSEGYLKSMEICVKRARFLAAEHGRRVPTEADMKEALDYMVTPALPPAATVTAPLRRVSARAVQADCKAPARLVQPGLEAEFPRRGTLPKVGEPEPVLAG